MINENPKIIARKEALRRQGKLDFGWVAAASAKIEARLLELPELKNAKRISIYLAMPHEVQTDGIIAALRAAGRRLVEPAWNKSEAQYALAEFEPGEPMHPGHLGIMEPAHPRWVLPTDVDAILVPLVAFDRHLQRLGHGGGYFDRLLAGFTGAKIGLAFEAQRLMVVPVQEHDIRLDRVVTEQRVYDGHTPWNTTIDAPTDATHQPGTTP